ncbi:MAG: heme ABC exporter ATP-binding protein CcmA [Qingshengfaniella sp.]
MLAVSDLRVARGGLPVLEGLGFTLASGRVLLLRGPNGAGKTTLLRTLAGLQPPLGGRITLDRDQIAYAGHADGIKPVLTVAENLHFWAGVYGQADIGPALRDFALHDLRDRPALHLSAGQKRRLGLARLAVTGRRLWLLDEPTVSLDAEAVALVAAAIRAHVGQGGAAVIATHLDIGLEADLLDVGAYRAVPRADSTGFDEAFL